MAKSTEATLAELQKELVDLKIRVNNLEKRMTRLQKEVKPKPKTRRNHRYI